jgi:hypothetical protein
LLKYIMEKILKIFKDRYQSISMGLTLEMVLILIFLIFQDTTGLMEMVRTAPVYSASHKTHHHAPRHRHGAQRADEEWRSFIQLSLRPHKPPAAGEEDWLSLLPQGAWLVAGQLATPHYHVSAQLGDMQGASALPLMFWYKLKASLGWINMKVGTLNSPPSCRHHKR